jgi:hypothetical protein
LLDIRRRPPAASPFRGLNYYRLIVYVLLSRLFENVPL